MLLPHLCDAAALSSDMKPVREGTPRNNDALVDNTFHSVPEACGYRSCTAMLL